MAGTDDPCFETKPKRDLEPRSAITAAGGMKFRLKTEEIYNSLFITNFSETIVFEPYSDWKGVREEPPLLSRTFRRPLIWSNLRGA